MLQKNRRYVLLRFSRPSKLDTPRAAIGKSTKIDDKFYSLSAFVDVSEQFYGWILGFGRRVKLIGNEEAVKEFNAYLTKIYKNYNPETVADE